MRFENLHAKSVNASAKTFQEEEDERDKMRWGRSSSSRRIESSQAACWLMLIRRLINYQQNVLRGSSSKERQLPVATGNWQVVATLSGMLRFVVVLTYAMARTKKFTLHLDGCDKAARRHRRRWWWCWWGGSARRKSFVGGQAGRFGGSATINVTICDLCLASAWLTLWYLEFLWAHPVLRLVRSGDQRWQPSPSVDADDDCI